MPIEGLSVIGESINDSVPSTRQLFESDDLAGILALARRQDEKGAAHIDVNIGSRSPELMRLLVRRIQEVTCRPLAIDTPDYRIAAAGLEAYSPEKAGGKPPILNSISPLRMDFLRLHEIQPFLPILMVSERVEGNAPLPNRTAEETFRTAVEVVEAMREKGCDIPVSRCIIDPGIAPIGSDVEGHLKRVLATMKLMHEDPRFRGVHMSVGLSNLTVMLPARRPDGIPVRSSLESAFLTLAMPLGLDMVVGSVHRKYERLPGGHPAVQCLEDMLKLEGYDAIARLIAYYSG